MESFKFRVLAVNVKKVVQPDVQPDVGIIVGFFRTFKRGTCEVAAAHDRRVAPEHCKVFVLGTLHEIEVANRLFLGKFSKV